MMLESEERRAVGLEQFAKIFDVSKDTAIRAAKNGTLRTIRIGARRLVPMSEVYRVEREGLTNRQTKKAMKEAKYSVASDGKHTP